MLPRYATVGSAGMDLVAIEEVRLPHRVPVLARTGIKIAVPAGYEAQVRPRSGLAIKRGITVLNAPGTIDSDYRGEVGVILINLGPADLVVLEPMTRIAQLVVLPVPGVELVEVDELPASERGVRGFGSSAA